MSMSTLHYYHMHNQIFFAYKCKRILTKSTNKISTISKRIFQPLPLAPSVRSHRKKKCWDGVAANIPKQLQGWRRLMLCVQTQSEGEIITFYSIQNSIYNTRYTPLLVSTTTYLIPSFRQSRQGFMKEKLSTKIQTQQPFSHSSVLNASISNAKGNRTPC